MSFSQAKIRCLEAHFHTEIDQPLLIVETCPGRFVFVPSNAEHQGKERGEITGKIEDGKVAFFFFCYQLRQPECKLQ